MASFITLLCSIELIVISLTLIVVTINFTNDGSSELILNTLCVLMTTVVVLFLITLSVSVVEAFGVIIGMLF